MLIPSNLPREFHASGKPTEVMRRILCKHYGIRYIPIFVSRYARKVNDEKIEQAIFKETRMKNIPKATLVRQIVWTHYGYGAPTNEIQDAERKARQEAFSRHEAERLEAVHQQLLTFGRLKREATNEMAKKIIIAKCRQRKMR